MSFRILPSGSPDSASPSVASLQVSSPELFPGGTLDTEASVKARIRALDGRRFARGELLRLFQNQHADLALSDRQRAHLAALDDESAVVIVTGQQPGLFGGPALSLYKALSCIQWAHHWSQRLGRPVVPIFWIAGDDSDLEECNRLELLEAPRLELEGSPFRLALEMKAAHLAAPVGSRLLGHQVSLMLERLRRIWPDSDGGLDLLRAAYRPGRTFSEAFRHLFQSYLGETGILFLDAWSPAVRRLSHPMLTRLVDDAGDLEARLLEGEQALQGGGHKVQVKHRLGMLHAFELRQGLRYRLRPQGAAYAGDVGYVGAQPGELSHDVLSRPLVADSFLPVLGHVLGPAEMRYFAQLAPAFGHFLGGMPLVQPRASAVVFRDADLKLLESAGISPVQAAFSRPGELRQRFIDSWAAQAPEVKLLRESGPRDWLQSLDQDALALAAAPGNHSALKSFQRRVNGSWDRFVKHAIKRAWQEGEGHGRRAQAESTLHWLGMGRGQDRHLWCPSLVHQLGEGGLASFLQGFDARSGATQFLELPAGSGTKGEAR